MCASGSCHASSNTPNNIPNLLYLTATNILSQDVISEGVKLQISLYTLIFLWACIIIEHPFSRLAV